MAFLGLLDSLELHRLHPYILDSALFSVIPPSQLIDDTKGLHVY